MRILSRKGGGAKLALRLGLAVVFALSLGLPPALGATNGADGHQLQAVRWYQVTGPATKEQRSAVAATGADIVEIGTDSLLVRALPDEAEAIARLGFGVSMALGVDDFPPVDANFHNYAEVVADINAVAAAHANIVSVFSVGLSYENREMWAAKISDHVGTDEAEPEVLYDALHHAREHLTTEEGLAILHLFADNYGSDTQVTNLVDSREIYIVFEVNPDGGEWDIHTGNYLGWRLNRQPNPGFPVGTDLNRNYGYKWDCCGGSSDVPGSETYHGAAPFSAPETQRIRDFVQGRVVNGVQQIRTAISFHTYSELVLWPYGYTFNDVPSDMTVDDHNVFTTLGTSMAQSTCMNPYGCFTPEQASDLYITDGTSMDWLYGTFKLFTFTIEMYPKGSCGFYCPDEQIPIQTSRVQDAVLQVAEAADCPFEVTPAVQAQYCPTITGLSPRRAQVGQTVTIDGSGFTDVVGVAFNGKAATNFTVVSPTKITAVIPAGATTGFVTVEKARGTGTSPKTIRIR
jgi:hypothetical protein